jgi:hypothetical protein
MILQAICRWGEFLIRKVGEEKISDFSPRDKNDAIR